MWIFLISWGLHYVANKEFHKETYRIVNGSSMYAYLSHYFFIIVVAVTLIRPYKIPFVGALFIEFILVNLMIIISYLIFDFLWSLAFPRKTPE